MEGTHVVKSKSSNSGKTAKSEHRNKKSRSNAELPPYVMKKRGVYVEPNRIRTNELEKNQRLERPKVPPRPRPGNKKFLASVLTILSKSTAGTQYPETDDPSVKKTEKRHRMKRNIIEKNYTDVNTNYKRDSDIKTKKKPKYRSKALNDEVDREVHQKQFVVLKSKKDIIQTPSIYSENDSLNWSNLPALVQRAQRNTNAIEGTVESEANALAKEIMVGAKSRKDRRVRIDEQHAQITEIKRPPKSNVAINDSNGKLYNFFVDLLETTISVYNVKQDYDKAPNTPSDVSSSKMKWEIDESVAKKLSEPKEKPVKPEVSEKTSNHFYCLKDLEFCNKIPDPALYERPKSARRRKIKTESFSFIRKPTKLKAESVIQPKKSFSRKQKKKTLLNLFKEQLRMDEDAFEEPQNLYQALKVIAQNKKKCQNAIHFNESMKRRRADFGFPECMFKRRNVISSSTKYTYKDKNTYPPSVGQRSELGRYKRPKSDYTTDFEDDSYHSLEVVGYEYETPNINKANTNYSPKDLLFTYHSTPSYSERSFGSKGIFDFSEPDSMYYF